MMEPVEVRLAVVGSRGWTNEKTTFDVLDALASRLKVGAVVSGGAAGADSLGEKWAQARGYKACIYHPDWKKHGRSAGFKRNSTIVENCDVLIAFWDGLSRGTLDTLRKARGKPRLLVRSDGVWQLYAPGEEVR